MVCALRVKGGDEVERQEQQQQAVQRPQRRGTAQLMQKMVRSKQDVLDVIIDTSQFIDEDLLE